MELYQNQLQLKLQMVKTISFNSRVPARDLYDISALILINMLVICPLFKRSCKTISC
jgi:hypothetical protein